MKKLNLLLLLLSLITTNITASSQSTNGPQSNFELSQISKTYSQQQNNEDAQINGGYEFSQTRTINSPDILSRTSTQTSTTEPTGELIRSHTISSVLPPIIEEASTQELSQLTQNLIPTTEHLSQSSASTASTLIHAAIVSSQDSNATTLDGAELHRAEEFSQFQDAQGDSYLYRISSQESN